ncbi:RING finger and transmembrane domain-containing protein 2 isoform X2 [Eurytemora carolleeae]|uniref:RING finger and transmembrane domain-containing protein 2 isoform X2 n=1 Tax=Eurytemora carolleeae TaxID=1294199 RepID=UPI000C75864A|nr:RING finger and transmembrane domain-containing protein 2 isoform X2 [Eurytemora carolleeae]|eukprot:XP_023347262.1 RING finger and transmembrane domain-containing protein 2-like isoform X2 [Eurytemora affinis]
MSSSGQGAAGGEESAVVRPEGQPIQRHGLTTRRIREDLQNVVRSSLTPIMEVQVPSSLAQHISSVLPVRVQPGPSWAPGRPEAASWVGQPLWNPQQTSPSSAISFSPSTTPSSPLQNLQPGYSSTPGYNVQQPGWNTNTDENSHVMDMDGFQNATDQEAEAETHHEHPQPPPQQEESSWSQILNSNPELRTVASACERYIPFCFLVLIKSVFDHWTGILVCLGLVLTFLHANSVLKHQIGRQARRTLGPLFAVTLNLCFCTFFIYYVFFNDKLSLSAFFIHPGEVCTFYDLLWVVGINDFFLKFLAVLTKIIITVLPPTLVPYQKRGKFYLFVEVTSQLHRQLAPIQPWLMYLLHDKAEGPSSIPNKVLGVFLTAGYMVVKGKALMKAIKLCKGAFHKVLQSTRYGKTPTQDQMKASGGFCPICQDNYQVPTMLHCKHIFCEECVTTWFDRDTTCPMCRAKVSEDPAWRDGSTSQFIQLF